MSYRAVICLLILTSCTISPLYKQEYVGNTDSTIKLRITPRHSKAAYLLTKKLNSMFATLEIKEADQYTLKVNIDRFFKNIAISRDQTLLRKESTYVAKIELLDKNYNTKLRAKIESAESHNAMYSSSNIIQSTYGNTDENQMELIARKIVNHIGATLNAD